MNKLSDDLVRDLPEGTVTFLFTDIEGSTKLLRQLGDEYAKVLADQRRIMRTSFARWHGSEVDTQGDSFFVSFPRASEAVAAAVEIQRSLAEHGWPQDVQVRVRMGLHTGEPLTAEEGYVGMDVHRAARIAHIGHGSQVLLSATTTELVIDELPEGVSLLDLSRHRLKDISRPEHIRQLDIQGLPSEYPPLKSLETVEAEKPSIPNNLPVQSTPFIGREEELTALEELLIDPDIRLITIVGPGGMGKTRLVLEAAQEQVNNFDHGVWFISLTKLSSDDEIVPAVAQTLGFSFYEGGGPKQQLLDYLRNKSLFLVLDNFEHLLTGGVLVSDILKNAPEVKILATSREPLRLVEEQLFPLDGLAFARERVSKKDAAVQLFLERARRVQPGLTLAPAGIPHVTTICRQVDGMPLGLELAAAWTDTLSLSDIAAELQQSLDLLETDMRNLPSRHRSMRAVFDVSYERLQPDKRQIFARMSVFRGGFTRSAAWEICAPELNQPIFIHLLASLTRKAFLQYDADNDRYHTHELMRQYGAEKLAEDLEQETAVRDRHAAYFCEFLHQLGEDLKGNSQKEAAKEIEADFENGRVAWRWATNRQMFDHLQKTILLWDHFLVGWRSRHREADSLYESLVESLTGNDSLVGRQLLIQALICLANCKRSLGHFEEAVQLRQEAQTLFLQPPINDVEIWSGKSFVLRGMWPADLQKHIEWNQQGLELARRVGDLWEQSYWLHNLGNELSGQGRFAEAEPFFREALMIGKSSGDQFVCADVLISLSDHAHNQYHFEEAEQLANESLALFSALDNQNGVAECLDRLGHIYLYCGRYTEAIKTYRDRLQLYEELGSPTDIAWSHYWLSHTYLHAGEYAKSKAAAEIFLSTVRGAQFDRACALTMLANNALIKGDCTTAESYFAESEPLFRTTGRSVVQIWHQGYHVVTLAHCGKVAEARQAVCDTLDVKTLAPTGIILFAGIALFYWAEKRWERAIELYAMACTNPYAGKSQWVADMVGQKINKAAAKLPQEIVQAARRRGKELNLWEAAKEILVELEAEQAAESVN